MHSKNLCLLQIIHQQISIHRSQLEITLLDIFGINL